MVAFFYHGNATKAGAETIIKVGSGYQGGCQGNPPPKGPLSPLNGPHLGGSTWWPISRGPFGGVAPN